MQKLWENIEKRRKHCENIVFIANTSNQGAEIRKSAKKTGPEKGTFSYYNPFEKMRFLIRERGYPLMVFLRVYKYVLSIKIRRGPGSQLI